MKEYDVEAIRARTKAAINRASTPTPPVNNTKYMAGIIALKQRAMEGDKLAILILALVKGAAK